jgi:hypothetical protein
MDKVGATTNTISLAAVASFAAVGAAILKVNKSAIEAAKTYETLGLAFRFAAREGENVAAEFARLVDFADRTPFDTADLVRYSIQLKNVTSGLFGTVEQIELMAGALTKAKVLGKDKTFINSVGQIINAFQIGGGRLKLYIRTLQATGAISVKTALAIKELKNAGGSAADVIALLTKEFKSSQKAALEFSKTAEGLESTLKSRFDLTRAGLAGEEGLDNYKLILTEINALLKDIRSTESFKNLATAFGDLNAEILRLVKSDAFKVFLLDVLRVTTMIVRAISAVIHAFRTIAEIGSFTTKDAPRFTGIGASAPSASDEIERMNKSRQNDERMMLEKINKNVNRSASVLDPQKTAGDE